MKLQSLNNMVACRPFQKEVEEIHDKRKLASISKYVTLAPLVTAMSFEMGDIVFSAGDTVYVKGDRCNAAWAKEQFQVEGFLNNDGNPIKFILVPVSEIIAKKTWYPSN